MDSTSAAIRLFQLWAPPDVVWSQWVKPVIFAQELRPTAHPPSAADHNVLKHGGREGQRPGGELEQTPAQGNTLATLPLDQATALVIDLPGAEAIDIGLRLMAKGLRPLPLFNTCNGNAAVVNVNAIIAGLQQGAITLQQHPLPVNAPPAFLLDSRRNHILLPPKPGDFDNRWLVFPYDFPSATFLGSQGIKRVILLYDTLAEDLSHVLQRWQEGGVTILTQRWSNPSPLEPYAPRRPRYFRQLWYAVLISLAHGLHYSNVGGFGAVRMRPEQGRVG